MATIIQLRRDTAANWTSNNPILAEGEPAYETDTLKEKLGDGITAWNSLPYKIFGGLETTEFIEQTYANMNELYADQANQTNGAIQFVSDAVDHTKVEIGGYAYLEYLGTTLGNETDYRLLSSEEALEVASGSISEPGEVISDIIPVTQNYILTTASNNAILRIKDNATVIVTSGLSLKHRTVIKKKTNKTVSLTPGKNVILESPEGYLNEVLAENDAIEIVLEEIADEIEYWGVYGALKKPETLAVLIPDQTSVYSIAWPNIYKSSDYPEFSTTKQYFTIYSPDHSIGDGGIFWAEFEDLEFNGFEEKGKIIDGYQAEFPWLLRRSTAKTGISDELLLFYHTNTSDPSNVSGAQETHLITTSGGEELHLCTWTQRGKVLGLEAGENHTGYLRAFNLPDGTLVGHHLKVGGDGGSAGVSVLDTGLNWTRKEILDNTQGMPSGGVFGRFSIKPFSYNGNNYSFIDYRDPQGVKHLAISQLDEDFLPINVTPVLPKEYEDHVAEINGEVAYIYIRPGEIGIGENPEGYYLERIYIPDYIL